MIPEHARLQAYLQAQKADQDATIRRMARSGRTDAEIGQHFGRDRQWARRRRIDLGERSGHNPILGAMLARLHLRRRGAIPA